MKFKDLTDLVSANKPHLGIVPLLRKDIQDASKISQGYHPYIKQLKQKVLKELDKQLKISKSVLLASLCDPALKSSLGMSREEQSTALRDAL